MQHSDSCHSIPSVLLDSQKGTLSSNNSPLWMVASWIWQEKWKTLTTPAFLTFSSQGWPLGRRGGLSVIWSWFNAASSACMLHHQPACTKVCLLLLQPLSVLHHWQSTYIWLYLFIFCICLFSKFISSRVKVQSKQLYFKVWLCITQSSWLSGFKGMFLYVATVMGLDQCEIHNHWQSLAIWPLTKWRQRDLGNSKYKGHRWQRCSGCPFA